MIIIFNLSNTMNDDHHLQCIQNFVVDTQVTTLTSAEGRTMQILKHCYIQYSGQMCIMFIKFLDQIYEGHTLQII